MFDFFAHKNGRLKFNWEVMSVVASRPLGGPRPMTVVVRSMREFRRFIRFGDGDGDLLIRWLRHMTADDVLYDVGASNALEAFYANCLHGNRVVMIEPFTPSIETILKSVYIHGRLGGDTSKFEVVHAACAAEDGFGQLFMHKPPMAGVQTSSFEDTSDYVTGDLSGDGRVELPVTVRQWTTSITLDSLCGKYGLPMPSYVKIDVDGFEIRVMTGAANLIKSRHVKSWAIEINGAERDTTISAVLSAAGYDEIGRYHHRPPAAYPCDCVYVRDDLAAGWRVSLD